MRGKSRHILADIGVAVYVFIGERSLGKPSDLEEAVGILRRLSGRSHEVWTAVRISHAARGRSQSFHEMSRVHFRELDEAAIQDYLGKIDPLDKAGAYAVQAQAALFIESIEGDYWNVTGLPVSLVYELVQKPAR